MLGGGRGWRVCAGFTVGLGDVGGRGMAGLYWLHYRLSLCKGEGGGEFLLG